MTRTTKALTALAAAATFGVAAIAAPQVAEARGHHHHRHFIFIGAPIGAYAYYDPFYYGGCYWTHERVWDGVRWHLRRVKICG
ncbi:MAG TPA: hypothetical protein VEH78_04460 [Pseudolabrys sp.]|nr:hypothetical protein [Pseudolabrys sp.]